jgi:hypothetical protein
MMDIDEILREVTPVSVDPETIRAYTRPYEHLKLATDLYRELSQWLAVLANAYTDLDGTWDLKQAVIAGLLVRQFKLSRHLMGQVVADQGELLWVTIRLLAEGAINLRYLLRDPSIDLIQSYVTYSLYHERDLKRQIEANIQARGGEPLPIENRMLRSIDRTSANSLVDPATLGNRRPRDWAGKSLRERARTIGLEGAYDVTIGGPSRNVHGNWYDLLQHHLEVVTPGRYKPRFTETQARPQALLAMAHMTLPALTAYLAFLSTADTDQLAERLEDLDTRILLADRLHEAFLQRGATGVA